MRRVVTSEEERLVIFHRDGFSCVYCFEFDPKGGLLVDHVIPYSKGGLTVPENLVSACDPCNSLKSNSDAWIPVRLEELV